MVQVPGACFGPAEQAGRSESGMYLKSNPGIAPASPKSGFRDPPIIETGFSEKPESILIRGSFIYGSKTGILSG